jgi:8-oxo-dGTP pyrophosphatase MutT (NUDIX family)
MNKKLLLKNDYFNINTNSIITYPTKKYKKYANGILLYRKSIQTNQYEILLIKSPISYALTELVFGRYMLYTKKDDIFNVICKLTNNITPEEKRLFCTFDFDILHFYITNKKYNNIVFIETLKDSELNEYKSYSQASRLFYDNIFVHKEKIYDYINQSYNKHINLWQIPKGKKNGTETDLDCAVREFYEETNINYTNYNILINLKPIKFSTHIGNIEYITTYFIAILRNNMNPRLDYKSKNKYIEVTDIRWVPINKLDIYISNEHVYNTLKNLTKHIKNIYKQRNKICSL